MRLGIFREDEAPPAQEELIAIAKRLLVSSLNKGRVPTWEEFFPELPVMNQVQDLEVVHSYFRQITEWPFLCDILSTPANEYFFHSCLSIQRLLPDGTKEELSIPLEEEDWQLWLEILSVRFKQNWNVKNPFASFYAELFGKSYRLSLIHGSTSPKGNSKLMVRSIAGEAWPLDAFGSGELLEPLVRERKNILIAGSTGSGKTSLLSSLLNLAPPEEHLVILEDTFEIISKHPHQTRLLSQGTEETSLKNYLSYSLRLSPDRIILGEMRSHEVVPFLMAMNTGHRGLMATVHASSASDALNRVALLFSIYGTEAGLQYDKVMELLCRNLEYVVFMEQRKVREVIKILGAERGVPFFDTL